MKVKVRTLYNFTLFLILLLMLPFGCSSTSKDSQKINSSVASPTLQLTQFQEHLLGHWVTENGRTHYYIGNGTIVMVDDGKVMKQKYTIYETNESEKIIKIQVITESNLGHKKVLQFSPDFKSIAQTLSVEVMGKTVEVSGKWNFVDSKTSP